MLCNLPIDLIVEKMSKLHSAIQNNIGIIPTTFRAGRWGFDEKVVQVIDNLGYKIDSSVSPFVDFRGSHGPDFSLAETFPYRMNVNDILRPLDTGTLLEVPPTIGFYQDNMKIRGRILSFIRAHDVFSRCRLIGLLDRLNLLNFRWLSPELSSGPEMVKLAKTMIRNGHRMLNMSFHSTTLLVGASPFVRSEQELESFYEAICIFLDFAKCEGLQCVPLSSVHIK